MSESKVYKTFVAFTFTEQSQHHLLQLQNTLKPKYKTVRWSKPHQFHITAAYLDMIDISVVTKAAITIAEIQKKFVPLQARITGIEGFPSKQSSKILYAKVGGNNIEYFLDTVHEIREALQLANIQFDTKSFVPHITIGRAKVAQNLMQFKQLSSSNKVTIDAVAVYISQHTEHGFEYTEIKV